MHTSQHAAQQKLASVLQGAYVDGSPEPHVAEHTWHGFDPLLAAARIFPLSCLFGLLSLSPFTIVNKPVGLVSIDTVSVAGEI